MPADRLLHGLPQLGVAPAVGQGRLKGHGVADAEIALQLGHLIAPRRQHDCPGGQRRTGGGILGIDCLDLSGQRAAGAEGVVLHLQLHLIGIVERVVGIVQARIVHDERIARRQTVDPVRLQSLSVYPDGYADVGGADQRLVGGRHAERRLIPGGRILLGVGRVPVLGVQLLGRPDFAVHDQHAARGLQRLGRDGGTAVNLGHPQVAVDGCQHGLPLVRPVVGSRRFGGFVRRDKVLAAVDDLQRQVGVGQAELRDVDDLGAVVAVQRDLRPSDAGGGAVGKRQLLRFPADLIGQRAGNDGARLCRDGRSGQYRDSKTSEHHRKGE